MGGAVTEVLFYHLTRRTLEDALPRLLEVSLERGWRVVVEFASEERRDAVDAHLWTYRDESFLPHGTARDGEAQDQPIFLAVGDANPNRAEVRFLVDRAAPGDLAGYRRIVLMFDGNDPDALAEARGHWKSVKDAGLQPTYWQEDESGRWVKKA